MIQKAAAESDSVGGRVLQTDSPIDLDVLCIVTCPTLNGPTSQGQWRVWLFVSKLRFDPTSLLFLDSERSMLSKFPTT